MLKKWIIGSLAICALLLASACSQDDEQSQKKTPSGGFVPYNGSDSTNQSPGTGNPSNPNGDPTEDQEYLHGDEDEVVEVKPQYYTRPVDTVAEQWWVSSIMSWYTGEFDSEANIPADVGVQIWSDPKNSDVGDPSFVQELTDAGKQKIMEYLTADDPNAERYVLPPAEGIEIHYAAAAKVYRPDGGPQLYRVAVLWSAAKGRELGRPVNNEMTEMYFYGTPGNIAFVSCFDAGENLCKSVFKKVML